MDVANLPAKTDQSSQLSPEERFLDSLAEQVAAGKRPDAIARQMYPNDPVQRKQMRRRLWNIVRTSEDFHRRVALRARGEMVLGMGPATRALVERASRGRPDAIKLLYEASGFHNPKVKHEHSGEIKVKLDMPRPKFEDEIVDAEVVDGPE